MDVAQGCSARYCFDRSGWVGPNSRRAGNFGQSPIPISNNYLFSMYGFGVSAATLAVECTIHPPPFKPRKPGSRSNASPAKAAAGETCEAFTSHLVALAGSREGVGITAIATNLAIALAEQTPGRVVLVDLARPFPAVCQFLNIKESHNIIDLIQNVDHLDPQFVENVLHKYNPNLSILLGNPDLTLNTCSILTDNVLNKIFKTLEGSFEWIVVDLGYWIDSVYLSVVRGSRRCVTLD